MVNSPSDPLAPRELDAQREAIAQLARRVRYLETLPFGGGDTAEYVKLWDGSGYTQSIPNDTDTVLHFDQREMTALGYVTEPATYPQLTVPSGLAGPYLANAGVAFEGQPEGQRRLWITIGDDVEEVLVAMQVDAAAAYFATELNVGAPAWLDAGYFVYAWAWQNSGGDLLVGAVSG